MREHLLEKDSPRNVHQFFFCMDCRTANFRTDYTEVNFYQLRVARMKNTFELIKFSIFHSMGSQMYPKAFLFNFSQSVPCQPPAIPVAHVTAVNMMYLLLWGKLELAGCMPCLKGAIFKYSIT